MLHVLHRIERELPGLLRSREGWKSLDVDYEPPRVERVFREVGAVRVYLHVIHPCAEGRALFHPHPWPSAMRVLSGTYEMAIGAGHGATPPPVVLRMIARAGLEYEMPHLDGWHSVRPIGGPSLSVMVTGAPWDRPSPKSRVPLRPLADARVDEILATFYVHYPG